MGLKRLVIIAAMLAGLAGCVGTLDMSGGSRLVSVDTGSAAAMVNSFRGQQGLGSVRVSSTLNAIARDQAVAMAEQDRMGHNVAGSLERRLRRGGYTAMTAAENLGVGYDSLGDMIDGWKKSSGHRANLLRGQVTEIGIAAAQSQSGGQRTYWALVVATPLD